jgi:hypothetical protein
MSIYTPKVGVLSCIVESKPKKISFRNEDPTLNMPHRGHPVFPPRKKSDLFEHQSPSEADIRGSNPELAGHTSYYYSKSSFYNTRNTFKI